MSMTASNSILYYIDTLTTDWPLRVVCTCLVPILSWFLGGLDEMVSSLFLLMAFDFVLGFCRGWKDGRISGDKMKHGAVKFILYGLTVWTAVLVQGMVYAFNPSVLGFKMSVAIRDWVVAYLVLNEGISCLEHLSYFGVPLPAGLIRRLKHYRSCIFSGEPKKEEEERRHEGA